MVAQTQKLIIMTAISYNTLNIHQKINWKNQFGACADRGKYHLPNSFRLNGVFNRLTFKVNSNPWFWEGYFIP